MDAGHDTPTGFGLKRTFNVIDTVYTSIICHGMIGARTSDVRGNTLADTIASKAVLTVRTNQNHPQTK